jgi:hypothetical protein
MLKSVKKVIFVNGAQQSIRWSVLSVVEVIIVWKELVALKTTIYVWEDIIVLMVLVQSSLKTSVYLGISALMELLVSLILVVHLNHSTKWIKYYL